MVDAPKLKKSATTDISKAAIFQMVIFMVPIFLFDIVFIVLLFFASISLFDLAITGVSFGAIYISTLVALIYHAKGVLADKDNYAPWTFIFPGLEVVHAWTYADHNVQPLSQEQREGMMVGGKYHGELMSTWDANEIILPETIPIPKSGGQRIRKVWGWTPAPYYQCVKPDTLMLGDNAPISDLGVGSLVMGRGGMEQVKETMNYPYSGDMIKVKASGLLSFETTPEHPILALRSRSDNVWTISDFTGPEWVQAKDLVSKGEKHNGHYLLVPRVKGRFSDAWLDLRPFVADVPQARREANIMMMKKKGSPLGIPLDEETAWLLGLYVAEGYSADNHLIKICLSSDEKDLADRASKILAKIGYRSNMYFEANHSLVLQAGSSALSRALREWCGHKAPNKKIPDFILFHNEQKILNAFLEGYSAGDGWHQPKLNGRGSKTRMGTVSRLLALQLQVAYARIGILASIIPQKPSREIRGRKVNTLQAYEIVAATRQGAEHYRVFDDYIATPVRAVEAEPYTGSVFNVETEDNTYCVSNAIVHNSLGQPQGIQTVSGALPVSASGHALAIWLITDLVNDPEQGHIGEPVAVAILVYSVYNAALFLEQIGKLMPTPEMIDSIKESAANKKMMTLQTQLKGTQEHVAVLAQTMEEEQERSVERVGEALKAAEGILRKPKRTIPIKWIAAAAIAVIVVSTLAALYLIGVI
jgi:intein/homing endonuclease